MQGEGGLKWFDTVKTLKIYNIHGPNNVVPVTEFIRNLKRLAELHGRKSLNFCPLDSLSLSQGTDENGEDIFQNLE